MVSGNNAITPEALLSIKNKRWLGLVRRLEQMAMTQNGHAMIQLTVIVNKQGEPVIWLTPRMTLIEPMDASQTFLDILSHL
jgi:hypothetical protein